MRYPLLLVFILLSKILFAQSLISLGTPSPAFGCPNTNHPITISVTNNSPVGVNPGNPITATVTIKDNTNTTVLGTTTQTITTGFASGATIYVTIPNVAFAGPMDCNVIGSASFFLFGNQNYSFTGTYTVKYPPTLVISENPVGTAHVSTYFADYSVRYFANADYGTMIYETKYVNYTPTDPATYTAKAYDPQSTCVSTAPSNAVYIKGTPNLTFPALTPKQIGDADFSPGASSTNTSTPITYTSSNEAVATIVGGMIHITGAGTTMITANQEADATHLEAPFKIENLKVNEGTATAVNNVLQASITTYPNPSSEYVIVKMENSNASAAIGILTDAMGAEIEIMNFIQTGSSLEASINVQTLTKGMYLLRIQSDKGIASTKVFVK